MQTQVRPMSLSLYKLLAQQLRQIRAEGFDCNLAIDNNGWLTVQLGKMEFLKLSRTAKHRRILSETIFLVNPLGTSMSRLRLKEALAEVGYTEMETNEIIADSLYFGILSEDEDGRIRVHPYSKLSVFRLIKAPGLQ